MYFENHTKYINALCRGKMHGFGGIKVHNIKYLTKLKAKKRKVSNKAIKYFGAANAFWFVNYSLA